MSRLAATLLTFAVLSSLSATRPSVRLQFAPADGASLALKFERVLKLELESSAMSVTYDGEKQGEQDPPGIKLTMTETETLSLADSFRVKQGEVVELRRHFEKIGNHFVQTLTDPAGESFEKEKKGVSELEGHTVKFQRTDEGAEFTASFGEDAKELDEDLLEGLDVHADFRGFLPNEEVDVGAAWEVELAAFIRMTNLSGDLHVQQEGEEDEKSKDYGRQFDENLSGDIGAKFAELREVDGRKLAVVALEMKLDTRIEISRDVDAEGVEGREQETHKFEIEIQGELLWDIAAGHAHSLDMKGAVKLHVLVTKDYKFEGHEMEIEETQDFDGGITFEASVE